MSIATQDAPQSPATTSAPESPATTSAAASENPKRLFAVTAVIVTPLAFVAALLQALPAGGGNAALIGVVPALFVAGFFGGLYWLAGALERDGRVTVVQPRISEQNPGLPKGSRAA
ncbi:MAG: hypothetical protein ACRD0O_11055 [Acidimicrobiia bacterium]